MSSPLRDSHAFPGTRHQNIGALVVRLLQSGGPAAVAFAIRAVIVFSIKALANRGITHVGKEVFKRAPSSAYVNAAPSVVWIFVVIFVVAPLSHTKPTTISRGVAVSVGSVEFADHFERKASTTPNFPLAQMLLPNGFRGSAFAHTDPHSLAFAGARPFLKHRQSAELLSLHLNILLRLSTQWLQTLLGQA